ncbi:MAG: sugar phosphate isomerase/epimerase [Acidobacteria bacterium]|nr:sugar phosphate isomerase/epimerase [Acidobacteriota bacterium]
MNTDHDRRGFLRRATCAILLNTALKPASSLFSDAPKKPVVCLFSKHLAWIKDYDHLAESTASLGFDGTDLTVRPGGHVLPERVEQDLPKAFESLKRAGAPIAMITTRIQDARDPVTRSILKTASSLGIRRYRRDGEKWEGSRDPIKRIAELQTRLSELAAMNKEYGLFAGIHNHSGFDLGATPWEVYELVKAQDARWMGSNFDVAHATIEGGLGGWRSGFRLLAAASRIQMLALKDFFWTKQGDGWKPEFCPLGQGMVDFKTFFGYLKEIGFAGPVSMHFEYGKHNRPQPVDEPELLAEIRRDLARLRSWIRDAQL